MKKLSALILSLALSAALLAGCGASASSAASSEAVSSEVVSEAVSEEAVSTAEAADSAEAIQFTFTVTGADGESTVLTLDAADGEKLSTALADAGVISAEEAEARGVILLAAAQCGVPIYEYTPMQVKQAITGYGKAVKKQIQEMTRIMLHLESVPKPDDTADALGMAIAHCHCSRSRLMGTPVR